MALVAAIAAALALAPAAGADSIAFIKGGDVHVATPDGSRQVQVTRGGGYSYVSQADDGTMIAVYGERLHKIARDGRVLADFATYVSDNQAPATGVNSFSGPFDAQISPDGSKVAFEWYNDTYGASNGCTAASFPPCYTYRSTKGVGITYSDRMTDPREFGLLTGWSYPQWVDNQTVMRSWAGTPMSADAVFNVLQPGIDNNTGDLVIEWFRDDEARDLVDMQLSSDRTKVVGVGGDGDELLRLYRPLEDPVAREYGSAERCWQWTDPVGGRFADPTFSPDGTKLYWAEGDGVHVADLVGDASAACPQGGEDRLLIAGATSPDVGPADAPAAAPVDPVKPEKKKGEGKKKKKKKKGKGKKGGRA
jgi:hypothetical protein